MINRNLDDKSAGVLCTATLSVMSMLDCTEFNKTTLVDPSRTLGMHIHPFGPISFIFMQFLVIILSNNRFSPQAQRLAPHLRNSGSTTGLVTKTIPKTLPGCDGVNGSRESWSGSGLEVVRS